MRAGKLSILLRSPPSYIGQIATRSFIASAFQSSPKTWMARTGHYARDTIDQIKVAFPNWYVDEDGATFTEIGPGATQTIAASIEYPAGTFYQLKFGGNATGTVADGGTLWTDWLSVSIPRDAQFFVRRWNSNSEGIVYSRFKGPWSSLTAGDAFGFGADKTMSGSVTDTGTNEAPYPLAIVGRTKRPSVALFGDSRVIGFGDSTEDATGDVGNLARSIGPNFGYMNFGVSGDRAQFFNASHTNRMALAAYCSHAIFEYGTNDIAAAHTLAAIQADLRSAWSLWPNPRRVFATTICPRTTGAWTLADGSDQTFAFGETTLRVPLNNWLRGIPGGIAGVFELADLCESSRDSGKWKADGNPGTYTADGIHETTPLLLQIAASGAIPAGAFRL